MSTLVDVGIPTHDSPRYLGEAIECVLAQTVGDLSLTISENGAGGDEIASIVRPYLDDGRVHHVVTGTDVGGARNSTRLLNAGSAPYIAILHDDDLWHPEFLARRVDFLDAHPTCGLVFSPCDFIDSTGSLVYRFDVDLKEGIQERFEFLRKMYRRNLICTPTALAPRWCYEAVGAEFDQSVLFYDYEMWLRIASRYEVGFLTAVDAEYRVHRSQTTQEIRRHWGEHRLAVLARAEEVLPPDFPQLERRRVLWETSMRAFSDALGRGDRHAALAHLGGAIREHPTAPVDPHTAVYLFGLLRRRGLRRAAREAALFG